jgi:hypothetical protein
MTSSTDQERKSAFAACPDTGCDWGAFWQGWQARAAVQHAAVAVPEADWVMHLLSDRWPESGERVEVEMFAEWLREVLATAPHPVSGEQKAVEMSDITNALETVPGAPMLSSNLCHLIAQAINERRAQQAKL